MCSIIFLQFKKFNFAIADSFIEQHDDDNQVQLKRSTKKFYTK